MTEPRTVALVAVTLGSILLTSMAFVFDWRLGCVAIGIVLVLVGLLVDVDAKERE